VPAPTFGPRFRISRPVPQSKPERAIESAQYRFIKQEDKNLVFHRDYELRTVDDSENPAISLVGSGTWTFNLELGVPHSLVQNLTYRKKGAEPLELLVTMERTSSVVLAKNIARDKAAVAEAQRKRLEESSTPNPNLIDELITQLKSNTSGAASPTAMKRLSTVAVVEAKRGEVLQLLRERLKNVRAADSETLTAFSRWADDSCVDELVRMLDEDHVRSMAGEAIIQRLAVRRDPAMIDVFIKCLDNGMCKRAAKVGLIAIGEPAEGPVLKALANSNDEFQKLTYFEVLGSIGGEQTVAALEAMLDAASPVRKFRAKETLEAIRRRTAG
jgi:hypothetical protein